MKKAARMLLVLAGAAGSAQAQTGVTIYGIMDAAIVGERGGKEGAVIRITSGAAAASRIGFKGSEDLGGGLVFVGANAAVAIACYLFIVGDIGRVKLEKSLIAK